MGEEGSSNPMILKLAYFELFLGDLDCLQVKILSITPRVCADYDVIVTSYINGCSYFGINGKRIDYILIVKG